MVARRVPAMTYTKGPWSADWDDSGQWYIEPLGLTGTKLRGDSGDCEESANARLIAAAPELLEACKSALQVCRMVQELGGLPSTCAALENAIAKAEGGKR